VPPAERTDVPRTGTPGAADALRHATARRRGRTGALAAVGGAIGGLAPPPVSLTPLALLVALALLALAWRTADGWRTAALAGVVWAVIGQVVPLSFVVTTVQRFTDLGVVGGLAGLCLLLGVQSLPWAVGGAAHALLRRRLGSPELVAFPVAVLVACSLPRPFGWTPASILLDRPELVQTAEWLGERGTSVLVAAIIAVAVAAVPRSGSRPGAARVTVALLLASLLLGGLDRLGATRIASLDAAAGRTVRVGLVDPDAPVHRRSAGPRDPRVLAPLRRLTVAAERRGAALVAWPESAYPIALPHASGRITGGSADPRAPRTRAPLLLGLETRDRRRRPYNSAAVSTSDGRLGHPYDKLALLPIGERLPLAGVLPFLDELFPNASNVSPGSGPRLLHAPLPRGPALRIGVLICFEAVRGDVARALAGVGDGPDLLANLSNDAWFRGTTEPRLQELLARMRAIELRRPMVRATNGSPASVVDAAGRVRARRTGPAPAVLVADVPLRPADAPRTLHARLGDGPTWILALVVVLVTGPLRRRRAHQRT
jgi:apolipoprotein N-acyltransferase